MLKGKHLTREVSKGLAVEIQIKNSKGKGRAKGSSPRLHLFSPGDVFSQAKDLKLAVLTLVLLGKLRSLCKVSPLFVERLISFPA